MVTGAPVCKYQGSKVLLVEGVDDCHVVMALCRAFEVPETFGVYACDNADRALKRLNALIEAPDRPAAIGVALDADQNVSGRWQSIRTKLRTYSFPFPEQAQPEGTIVASVGDYPRLGIWLMPDNQAAGMLEDFCLSMVDAHVREYVSGAVETARQQAGVCTFKAAHLSKAVAHTYLAWQDEPGAPLGQAITKQALAAHTPTAEAFVRWLNRLFNEPEPPVPA